MQKCRTVDIQKSKKVEILKFLSFKNGDNQKSKLQKRINLEMQNCKNIEMQINIEMYKRIIVKKYEFVYVEMYECRNIEKNIY